MRVTEKLTLSFLSLSDQKDWQMGPYKSFFWYDTDCRFVVALQMTLTLYACHNMVVSEKMTDWTFPATCWAFD